jgi:hypothetical protein
MPLTRRQFALTAAAVMLAGRARAAPWADVLDQARGQTVYWHAWGGDPRINDFIAFVGDLQSGDFARQVVGAFRRTTRFPAYGCALPGTIEGVGWSDHWSFWQAGYPGVMVTDTAPFRYPHYHTPEDTADKLDFERTARVVAGLERVILEIAEPTAPAAGPTVREGPPR